jgi:hypothetical protein
MEIIYLYTETKMFTHGNNLSVHRNYSAYTWKFICTQKLRCLQMEIIYLYTETTVFTDRNNVFILTTRAVAQNKTGKLYAQQNVSPDVNFLLYSTFP